MTTATIDRPVSPALQARLLTLVERTNDAGLQRLARGDLQGHRRTKAHGQECCDWISTSLMEAFRNTGDAEVFALLFELNRGAFLQAIKSKLRRSCARLDANDVLQEVFLSIYRYPHRFVADRADAFRAWGFRIVRNTLFRVIKSELRQPTPLMNDQDPTEPEDPRSRQPALVASEQESAVVVDRAYMLFLGLYLFHFQRLTERERRMLTLAEIEGWSYREIGKELGSPVTSVKMTIFRIRRRISRGMGEALAALARSEFVAHPPAAESS